MTKEQAIKIIRRYECNSEHYEACEIAIKALEQSSYNSIKTELKPCEDAISRQAVRDTIFAECSGTKLDIDFAKILLLQRAIKALPPVTPQEPCEDCISRSEVIKSIDEREDVNGKVDAESVRTDIVLIPPVNPQNCDNCEVGNPCLYCKHEFEERSDKE